MDLDEIWYWRFVLIILFVNIVLAIVYSTIAIYTQFACSSLYTH
jgi:hypothetical protein